MDFEETPAAKLGTALRRGKTLAPTHPNPNIAPEPGILKASGAMTTAATGSGTPPPDEERTELNTADLLTDAFDRVRETVHGVVDGLTPKQLAARVDGDANSIAWLIWHLTRVQDDHVAEVTGTGQIWTTRGWVERFGLPLPASATGYGHDANEVAAVRVDSPKLLTGYYDQVHERTIAYVRGLTDADLDRIVDRAWTPPVTLGARLVSVINDDTQHAGQAAFVRGIILGG